MSTSVLGAYEEFIGALGLEDREGQRIATWNLVEMVRGGTGESLALQAPTGTGKSVSALLAGVEGARIGRRTAIGTATVMLSEQYWEDIEKVSKVFPDVDFFVLKGAAHYICWNKVDLWERLQKSRNMMKYREGMAELNAWVAGTSVMDAPPFWAAADPENCKECRESTSERGLNCEYAVARARAQQADVVVTSHAMLMIDLRLKRSVQIKQAEGEELTEGEKNMSIVGQIDSFIFDEAHKLGGQVNENSLSHWDVGFMERERLFGGILGPARGRKMVEHFAEMSGESWNPWQAKNRWMDSEFCVSQAEKLLEFWPTKSETAKIRQIALDKFNLSVDHDRAIEICSFLGKSRELLEDMANGSVNGFVAFWNNGNGYSMKEMAIRPWFSKVLREFRVAYVSATLGVRMEGKELYALDTLGVEPNWTFEVETPFNYAEQMEIAEVDWKRVDGRGNGLVECVGWFARRLRGGTVVLTGTHKEKDWITREMQARGIDARSQASGKGAAKKDRKSIAEHIGSCAEGFEDQMLVGVDTFSTGMNLSGSGLTCLFIHGLKPIRDDGAYVAWRKRWLESEGKDGFLDYELPEKAIVLEQQIGRLIRTQKDWGAVLLGFKTTDPSERAVVDLALSAFEGYNRVELTEVGKRWW